jgi:prepilin-type N-terminal cleavage/methylation domain-containing protein
MQLTNLTTPSHNKTLKISTGLMNNNNQLPPLKSNNKVLGFSLIEVLVAIFIAGIALTIAVPNLSTFTIRMRVDNEVYQIQRLLMTTRNAAINSGAQAILCPLAADNTCANNNNWSGRIGVFTDDQLIKEREAIKQGDVLQFAFNQVTYAPSGQLAFINGGNFSYCPQGRPNFARAIILSLSGRTFLSQDINGDGLDQDRQNISINIVC